MTVRRAVLGVLLWTVLFLLVISAIGVQLLLR
jgi:hypothetical protein